MGALLSGWKRVWKVRFGGIEEEMGLDRGVWVRLMVGVEWVGGGMGKMVWMKKMMGVCRVVEVKKGEGGIMKKRVI
ncbi:L-lactate permease, partial [Neisseria sicca]|uniref:L-lactate permease n=1 Tax=Neisseria sicca TaxID=490 RepID=UPI001649B994